MKIGPFSPFPQNRFGISLKSQLMHHWTVSSLDACNCSLTTPKRYHSQQRVGFCDEIVGILVAFLTRRFFCAILAYFLESISMLNRYLLKGGFEHLRGSSHFTTVTSRRRSRQLVKFRTSTRSGGRISEGMVFFSQVLLLSAKVNVSTFAPLFCIS